MKHTLKLVGTLAYMLIATLGYSQVPQKFNYQGIARDAKGNPIGKQQMSLKLSVLPTSDATEAEYEETQLVTTNEFGLYTLQIGNGTAVTGEMKTVKWETGNKYIKVAIDPKGGTDYVDMGTSQLLSVPYAIYADRAGIAANGGTTKGTRALNNFIEMTNGSGTTDQTSMIYQQPISGSYPTVPRLGINTTTVLPSAMVHIKSPVQGIQPLVLEGPATTGVHCLFQEGGLNRGYFGSYIGSHATPAYTGTVTIPSPLGTKDEDFDVGTSGANPSGKFHLVTNTTPRITILPSTPAATAGFVGVGIINPLKQFHVKGSTGARIERADGTNQSNALDINMGSSQYPGFTFPAGTVNLISQSTSPITAATTTSFADMTFSANTSTPQIVLKQSGNVGIGTGATLPAAKLDVNGTGQTTGIHATANQQTVAQTQSAITGAMGITGPFVEAIAIFGEAKATGSFPNGNNVGVAGSAVQNTSPQNNVGIMGEAGNAPGYNTAVAGQIIQGSGSYFENAAIRGSAPINTISNNSWAGLFDGKVGVRDGSQANNFVFTSNGTGTGTWMDPSTNPLLTTSPNDWHLNGNASTTPGTAAGQNFLGTTDNQDLVFGRNSIEAGRIGSTNVSLGFNSNGTAGSGNVAFGRNALQINSSGNGNTAIGEYTLLNNTTGSWNIAIGSGAAYNNNSSGNVAIGQDAMFTNTVGTDNTSIGNGSTNQNSIGSDNTALGKDVLYGQTTGSRNTAVGKNAMKGAGPLSYAANDNTAIGARSMENATGGSSNTAVGLQSMFSNQTGGDFNTAIGRDAMFFNTIGVFNSATGHASLNANTNGSYNTANGVWALAANTLGSANVAIGNSALTANNSAIATEASANTGVGSSSLSTNITGSYNTGLGAGANVGSSNLNYATAIGANSVVNKSNAISIGRSGGSVQDMIGINTSAPTSALQVVGSFATNIKEISTPVGILAAIDDYTFICSASATVELPPANLCKGRIYVIKRTGLTIVPSVAPSSFSGDQVENISGLGMSILPVGFSSGSPITSVTYQSDGFSKWYKIATAH